MTFLEMKQRLARRRGANATTIDTLTAARYADFINESYHALLRQPWAIALRDTTTTKASVAGTQSYTVTSAARINRIWETTNDIKLRMWTLSYLRDVDPDPQQGTPIVWIPTDVTKTSQTFILWPTPAAVITYTLDITSPITELSATGDVPLLPDDFHDLLVDMAERKDLRKADDPDRARMLDRDIAQGVKDLRAWVTNNPDWKPVMGGNSPIVPLSTLGGWYPAGN